MITLDPEFVGSLAPPPQLTTAVDDKLELPYARLPRLERLKVSGKADETEDANEDADGGSEDDIESGQKSNRMSKAEKEKNKMRGKNKSLKRCVLNITAVSSSLNLLVFADIFGNSVRMSLTLKR
jgi:U3 small nucleolar RNA-associated protein 7